MSDADREPLSDLERREKALAGVRDALAALEGVPAAGLDAEKHETLRAMVSKADSLESALTNEVSQKREAQHDE